MTQKHSELEELIAVGIINEETARNITAYWSEQEANKTNRLPIVFSILGGLLVGLGIILMVAHNWDHLSHFTKMFFAFSPVLIGQSAGLYTLLKRPDSQAWREGSSVFLIFAIGACIAMISQIYHVEGEISSFLFIWIWLTLPIMYVLDSAMASLLFWVGISMYAMTLAYDSYPNQIAYWYLFFAAAAIPFYWMTRKKRPGSNAELYHNWVIPLSLAACLGTLFTDHQVLNWVNYQLLYVILFMVGYWLLKKEEKLLTNGWMMVGLIATVGIALTQSFSDYWEYSGKLWPDNWAQSTSFYTLMVLLTVFIGLLVYISRNDKSVFKHPLPYLGFLAIIHHILGNQSAFLGAVLGNLVVLGLGLYYIWLGTKKNHLLVLNFGLIMLSLLIICRFFDTEISFAIRGLLFLLMGGMFFVANIYLIKQRAKKETTYE